MKRVSVKAGHRYKGLLDIPWPASTVVDVGVVTEHLIEAGLTKEDINVKALGHGKFEVEGVSPQDAEVDIPYLVGELEDIT